MSKMMFRSLLVLRHRYFTDDEFINTLRGMTKDKTAILVSKEKRHESRSGNKYWEYNIESDFIRKDNDLLWMSQNGYINLGRLNNWYIRIKDV